MAGARSSPPAPLLPYEVQSRQRVGGSETYNGSKRANLIAMLGSRFAHRKVD